MRLFNYLFGKKNQNMDSLASVEKFEKDGKLFLSYSLGVYLEGIDEASVKEILYYKGKYTVLESVCDSLSNFNIFSELSFQAQISVASILTDIHAKEELRSDYDLKDKGIYLNVFGEVDLKDLKYYVHRLIEDPYLTNIQSDILANEEESAFIIIDKYVYDEGSVKNNPDEADRFQKAFYRLKAIEYNYKAIRSATILREDFEKRIFYLNAAVKLAPDFALYYFNLALYHYICEEYYLSVQYLSKAIDIDPYNDEYCMKRGTSYYRLNMLDNAEADYRKALSINPGKEKYYLNIGIVLNDKGMFKEALDPLDIAIMLNDKNAVSYSERAASHAGIGNMDAAIENLDVAISLEPKSGDYYYNRGYIYFQLEKYEESYNDLFQSIKLGIGNLDVLYLCGSACLFLERYKNAIKCFDKILSADKEYVLAYIGRGSAKLYMNKVGEALLDANMAAMLGDSSLLDYISSEQNIRNLRDSTS